MADGSLSEEEILFLQTWLNANKQYCRTWPVNVICARLEQILEDEIIDPEERIDLFDLISKAIGHDSAREFAANLATSLPLTRPTPPIFFRDKAFCITGRMVSGCRKHCEEEITTRGGAIHDRVSMKTDYLIIGLIGSTDWLHTTHGRKIEYAVHCQKEGSAIAIISEEH